LGAASATPRLPGSSAALSNERQAPVLPSKERGPEQVEGQHQTRTGMPGYHSLNSKLKF